MLPVGVSMLEAVGDEFGHQHAHAACQIGTELGVFCGHLDRRDMRGRCALQAFAQAMQEGVEVDLFQASGPGVSNAETTAERTFVDRAGVCRDFTHLGITLSRALGIPTRDVSAYALQLEPPDFHAIFEVFPENNWWLIDPTRLAPIEGIVRIGSGRDASDIAFLTSDKQCQVLKQTIAVSSAR